MSAVLLTTESARPELVVQAYHVLLSHHRPELRLVVVGDGLTAEQRVVLREYGRQLNLGGLTVTEPGAAVEHEGAVRVEVVDTSPLVLAEAILAALPPP